MTVPDSDWSERYVLLKGGLAVPIEPYQLVFALEARGYVLTKEGDDLIVRPGRTLTDADRAAIAHWKYHILALLEYEAPEV